MSPPRSRQCFWRPGLGSAGRQTAQCSPTRGHVQLVLLVLMVGLGLALGILFLRNMWATGPGLPTVCTAAEVPRTQGPGCSWTRGRAPTALQSAGTGSETSVPDSQGPTAVSACWHRSKYPRDPSWQVCTMGVRIGSDRASDRHSCLLAQMPPSRGTAPPDVCSAEPIALCALRNHPRGSGMTLTRFKGIWVWLLVASIAISPRGQEVGFWGGGDTPTC